MRVSRIVLFFCLLITVPAVLFAQPHPSNVKVLDEFKDGKGNIVRKVQYNEGLMLVTETIIEPITPGVGLVVPIKMDTAHKNLLSIIVSKKSYRLYVKYGNKVIRQYKAVFGPTPQFNKVMEGDRNTPEGEFRIASKNPASKYDKFLGLNYPNDSCMARFNRLKACGKLPASARIGGNVGIHGIWNGGDDMIQLGIGWTDGCIALKNKDIEDLFSIVEVGTRVVIKN